MRCLQAIWLEKLRWVHEHGWQALEEVHLDSTSRVVAFRCADFQKELGDTLPYKIRYLDRSGRLYHRWIEACKIAEEALEAKFRARPLAYMRWWIAAGCQVNLHGRRFDR